MNELPAGWVEASLGEVAETRLGKMLSAKARGGADPRPYLRNKNVQWGRIDLDDLFEMDFSDEELDRFGVVPGDLLVCEGGEVGRAAIWRGQLEWIGYQKALHRVRPLGGVSPEYLLYGFMWLAQTRAFEPHVNGSTIKHLPQEDLRLLRIPLPPLHEQRRIVAATAEHLSRLDAADASLAAAARRLEALRSASLAAAMKGSWDERPWSEVILSLRNGVFVSRPAATPPGTAIFRISAVRPLALNVDDIRYASLAESEASDYLVNEGDLLFTRYSGNPDLVGACARVPKLPQPTLHPDKLIRVVVDRTQVDPAFVAIACATGRASEAIRARRRTTAGQVGIAGAQLKSVPVPVPPLEEQRRIVAEVEARLSAPKPSAPPSSRAPSRASSSRTTPPTSRRASSSTASAPAALSKQQDILLYRQA